MEKKPIITLFLTGIIICSAVGIPLYLTHDNGSNNNDDNKIINIKKIPNKDDELSYPLEKIPENLIGTNYYIDFDTGNDTNNGNSESTPWKHSPGDPNAEFNASSIELREGDAIYFKGGVTYRGTISSIQEGVIYDGQTWNGQKAILSGSEIYEGEIHSCTYEETNGNPHWERIYYIDAPDDFTYSTPMYQNGQMMWISHNPNLSDPFWIRNKSDYFEIPRNNPLYNITDSTITDSINLFQDSANYWDFAYVGIWAQPNEVFFTEILAFDPENDSISFTNLEDLQSPGIYTDRSSYYLMLNHISFLDNPGEIFYNPSLNRVYFYSYTDNPFNSELEISTEKIGFKIYSTPNITIQGFKIQNYHANKEEWHQGVAILARYDSDILHIRYNDIYNLKSMVAAFAVTLIDISNATIEHNFIHYCQRNGGISSGGENIIVKDNIIEKIGRTGISSRMFGGMIVGNHISQILDVHGNAISLYIDNQDILVANNYVTDTIRPLTYHGDYSDYNNNIVIYNNVFIGAFHEGTSNAIQGWGKEMKEVYILNNILIMRGREKFVNEDKNGGFVAAASDRNFRIHNNIIAGIGLNVSLIGSEYILSHNLYVKLSYLQTESYGWIFNENDVIEYDVNKIFVDANNQNFNLKYDSPAKNHGLDITFILENSGFGNIIDEFSGNMGLNDVFF